MSTHTSNMGLVKWDSSSDLFSHVQLAANFQSIDDHDHTTGKGLRIPAGGLASLSVATGTLQDGSVTGAKLADGSVGTVKIADANVTTGKIADANVTSPKLASGAALANLGAGTVTDGKLASSNNSTYKTIFTSTGSVSNAVGAGTFFLTNPGVSSSGLTSGASFISGGFEITGGSSYPLLRNLAAADYTVGGSLTAKLQLRAAVLANATQPTITFTFGLYPVTVAGGSGALTLTLGPVVPGSTIAIASPAASTATRAVTAADFTFPTDGMYALGCVTSASLTTNNASLLTAHLQVRNV